MTTPLPTLLIPGLACTPPLFAAQLAALWKFGPVTVADHTRGDSIAAMARSILDHAPPRFALVGFSMGGYVAFEILRQAADRIAKLALLDTSARPDTPQASAIRRQRIALAESGKFDEAIALQWPTVVHPAHREDKALKTVHDAMARDCGPDVYIRQQQAIMARADSRPLLASIACPTLVCVGDNDVLTPPALAEEMAKGIPGAQLVVAPEAGHLTVLEQPDAVRAALVEWMER